MLRYRQERRGVPELNGYTAMRLNEMARSLSVLARSFADRADGGGLTREDGVTAVRSAADLVCGSCSRCGIYRDSVREDGYFLYYLLHETDLHQKNRPYHTTFHIHDTIL